MEVQTTETENLKISAQTIEQVRAKNKELREECDKEGLDVDAQADKYDKELEELRQIADPEVRHQAVIGKGTGEEGLLLYRRALGTPTFLCSVMKQLFPSSW